MSISKEHVVVDVVDEKLAHAKGLGADAAVNAAKVDAAEAIRDITGGGAQVSVEALGIAATTNASVECHWFFCITLKHRSIRVLIATTIRATFSHNICREGISFSLKSIIKC